MPSLDLSQEVYEKLLAQAQAESIDAQEWIAAQLAQPAPLEKMVHAVPYMLYVTHLQSGTNSFINTYTERFFGMSLPEIQAAGTSTIIERLHPDDMQNLAAFNIQWDAASDEDVFIKEYRLRNARGDYRWLRSYESVLNRDEGGAVVDIIGTALDITQHKADLASLRQSEQRSRSLIETQSVAVTRTDMDGNYTYANQAFFERYDHGYDSIEALLGQPSMDSILEADHDKTFAVVESCIMQPGVVQQVELRKPMRDGGVQHTLWEFVCLTTADGVPDEIQCIGIEITELVTVQKALRESRAKFQAVFDQAVNAILLADDHGNYVDINQAACEMLGYSREELLTMNVSDVSANDSELVYAEEWANFLDDQRQEGEYRLRHKDGSIVITSYTATSNVLPGVHMSITQDVTERRRVEVESRLSAARYRALFNGTRNPIMVFDAQAHFLLINDAAAAMLTDPAATLINTSVDEHAEVVASGLAAQIKQVLQTGEPMLLEQQHTDADQPKWTLSALQPIELESGDLLGAQVIIYDITERKMAARLEIEHKQLELELLAQQELTEMRSRLLLTISHEFRTPLAIISSAGQLLGRYYDRMSAERRAQKINNIAEQIQILSEMLDDVSMLASVERGFLSYNPMPFDVLALCDQVVNDMRQLAQPHHHTIALEIGSTQSEATMDRKLVYHALTNLLSNAIKYSPEGNPVRLSVRCDHDSWYFSVEDNGIGIPEQEQAYLFDPFFRASNIENISGTGLGLSIVSEVAQQHGGSIRVESELHSGSTFTLILPAEPQETS